MYVLHQLFMRLYQPKETVFKCIFFKLIFLTTKVLIQQETIDDRN